MNGAFSGNLCPGGHNSGRRPFFRTLAAVLIVLLALLAACGDTVPEAETARQIGSVPKKTVDKVMEDAGRALRQGADRTREADGGGQ
jgi:hypothetical protein